MYEDWDKEDLIALIIRQQKELSYLKLRATSSWHDRMGGSFSQEEIIESYQNRLGYS